MVRGLIRPQRSGLPWWRLPFATEPYRNTAFVALTIPLALLSTVDHGTVQRCVVERLLRRRASLSRGRALAVLPLDAAAVAVVGYCWLGVVLNIGFPLRTLVGLGGDNLRDSWGGPTLVGAWAVHAVGGAVFLFVVPWVLRGFVAAWVRVVGGPSPKR